MFRDISKKIKIKQVPEKIYRSLITPSSITNWWKANSAIVIGKTNGIYVVSWGKDIDDPDFITVSKISKLIPNEILFLEYISYKTKFGKLPFNSKMNVQFKINKVDSTVSELEVTQTGIPVEKIADDYYNGCISGWENVLINIKKFCETL